VLSSKMLAPALTVLVLGTAATASARPKKQSAERTLTPSTMCDGTPIIMQGMDCPRRPACGAQQERATECTERPSVTKRGSGAPYIAPPLRPP
jgi:hypothetical protein